MVYLKRIEITVTTYTPSSYVTLVGFSAGVPIFFRWCIFIFYGKVIVNFPEGATFPKTSATEFPPSCPGCHGNRIASTLFFQLAVSITPPMFKTTTTFCLEHERPLLHHRLNLSHR
jgi:hypothetical protein